MKPSAIVAALLCVRAQGESVSVDALGVVSGTTLPEDARLVAELQQNLADHERECAQSCESFDCTGGDASFALPPMDTYSMGPTPSNDFPTAFTGEHHIFVTQQPLFPPSELNRVISLAEAEGDGLPTSKSGKYQIGKAWVKDMPSVLDWFNRALTTNLFPTLAKLFPELIEAPQMLRAQSVAILKFNATHPQTDVHVDDALLAFTIALSPSSAFEGGGTYFEHINKVVDMEQGHATFRPGSVRHAGSTVRSGLRYVLGGFIAVGDRVEHVRRLNERGSRLMLQQPDKAEMGRAAELFGWGLELNANCSLCHQNLGDVRLRMEEPELAEVSLRAQISLLPRDSDAYFSLGMALRGQAREREAAAVYEDGLTIQPNDPEGWLALAAARGAMGEYAAEGAAYEKALKLRPDDLKAWLNLGMTRFSLEDSDGARDAFETAHNLSPKDARPTLSLARMLAKQSRPAEAIEAFYTAAVLDAEYFDEVKLGVGTARAQQGRLAEATESFESASRMDPKNEKLATSLTQMSERAEELSSYAHGLTDQVGELCGTPCQDVVDTSGYTVCAITWSDGCGDAPPPEGFEASSTVAQMCAKSCAFYSFATKGK